MMTKEDVIKFALQLTKFVVAVILICIGQWLLDVPDPEMGWQLIRHIGGILFIYWALSIDWMSNE